MMFKFWDYLMMILIHSIFSPSHNSKFLSESLDFAHHPAEELEDVLDFFPLYPPCLLGICINGERRNRANAPPHQPPAKPSWQGISSIKNIAIAALLLGVCCVLTSPSLTSQDIKERERVHISRLISALAHFRQTPSACWWHVSHLSEMALPTGAWTESWKHNILCGKVFCCKREVRDLFHQHHTSVWCAKMHQQGQQTISQIRHLQRI